MDLTDKPSLFDVLLFAPPLPPGWSSPNIETIPVGGPVLGLPVDSDLTAMQARAIALEAAASKTGTLGSFVFVGSE